MSNVLAFPATAPPLPDYDHHQGRTIAWEPWTVAPHITCLGPQACEHCGSTAPRLAAAGRAQPLPGETFPAPRPRRAGHVHGGAYRQVQVPAWPVYRLCAFRCPGCGHVDVLDIDQDYAPVDTDRPTLF